MWSAGCSFISREYITSDTMKLPPVSFSWINVSVTLMEWGAVCFWKCDARMAVFLRMQVAQSRREWSSLDSCEVGETSHHPLPLPGLILQWNGLCHGGFLQTMGLFNLERSLCQDRAEYDTSDSGLYPVHLRVPYSIYCCSSSTSFILSFHFISILLYSWTNMCNLKNVISLAA